MWHNKHVNVWHFSRDIVSSGRLFRYHVLLTFYMEAVYGVRIVFESHDIMPDIVLYICYHTIFIFLGM
jgi:hypothetical protein